MKARRIFISICSAGEIARFFVLLSALVTLFGSTGGWGMTIAPWLLVAASAGLLVPVGGLLLSLYPQRYANLLGLLRLAKLLNLFSLVLLVLSGFISGTGETSLLTVMGVDLTRAEVLPAVMGFDLLFFVLLMSIRPDREGKGRVEPKDSSALSDLPKTEIEDIH